MTERLLTGQLAVVTGGGHDIGLAIARALARQGAQLALLGRNHARLQEAADALDHEFQISAGTYLCDVSDPASVDEAFADVRERSGDPHILVNNAGQAVGVTFLDTSLELWQQTLAVNLTGTFLCTKAVLPAMLTRRSGRIINIASTAGLKGYTRVAAYTASKHGVVGLTRALAAEVARQGVTVNAVCPAYTESVMSDRAVESIAQARGTTLQEARQRMERLIPIGRLIRPEEVAAAVVYLCSEAAGAVTGQAIAVAGGEV